MTAVPYRRSAASLAENPHAGQGPVLLDIGAESGGLVLQTGQDLLGAEVEIVPGHGHPHPHPHPHTHPHGHPHHRHAEVLARPLPDGTSQPCVVFAGLDPGMHTLRLLPHGPSMQAHVLAGTVTTVTWSPGTG